MGYVSMGDISTDAFNSSKYPGICKPSTVDALATFKRLQSQLNRVASVKGFKTIAVDGDIGPGTVGLFGLLQAHLGLYALDNGDVAASSKIASVTNSCSSVATFADVIANVADSMADSLNAPATAPAPAPTKPPTLVTKTGLEVPAPIGASLYSQFAQLPNVMKIAGIAVAAGLAYYSFGKKRKRRR